MNTTLDHIAPEVVQAIITQATARGLSINDFLRQLLGLTSDTGAELALSSNDVASKTPSEEEIRLAEERFARWIGAWDSGDPNSADNERIDADLAREYGSGLDK
jgi:hypothetical protein